MAVKQILESIPSAATAISLVVLTLAVIHETAFFLVVGYQLQALMSPTDYLFSALWWLPWVIVSTFLGYLIPVPASRKTRAIVEKEEESRTSDEIIALAAVRKRIKRITFAILIFALALLVLSLFFVDWSRAAWVPLLVFVCSMALLFYITKIGFIPFSQAYLVVAIMVPTFIASSIWWGVREGFTALEQVKETYIFKFNGDDVEHNWPIVRNLSRGVIVHDVLNNRVSFYKWENISMMSVRTSVPRWGSLICYFAEGRGCAPQALTP